MKPTANNILLKSVAEKKSILDGKKKLVIDVLGPDVKEKFKKGDRVFTDVGVEIREFACDGENYLVVKDFEIIAYEA